MGVRISIRDGANKVFCYIEARPLERLIQEESTILVVDVNMTVPTHGLIHVR